MSILTALNEAKGAICAIALIGGSWVTLDSRHDPKGASDKAVEYAERIEQRLDSEVTGIRSDLRISRILELAKQAKAEGSPIYLCNALDQEFILLCSEQPDHYLCSAETQAEIKSKAGC